MWCTEWWGVRDRDKCTRKQKRMKLEKDDKTYRKGRDQPEKQA